MAVRAAGAPGFGRARRGRLRAADAAAAPVLPRREAGRDPARRRAGRRPGHHPLERTRGPLRRGRQRFRRRLRPGAGPRPSQARPDGDLPPRRARADLRDGRPVRRRDRPRAAHPRFRTRRRRDRSRAAGGHPGLARRLRRRDQPLPAQRRRAAGGVRAPRHGPRTLDGPRRAHLRPPRRDRRQLAGLVRRAGAARTARLAGDLGAAGREPARPRCPASTPGGRPPPSPGCSPASAGPAATPWPWPRSGPPPGPRSWRATRISASSSPTPG